MLPSAVIVSELVASSLGYHDHGSPGGLSGPSAATPVPTTVTPMARMMDAKSTYPRIACSEKDGGMARNRSANMAARQSQMEHTAPLASKSCSKAMAPVRQCEAT